MLYIRSLEIENVRCFSSKQRIDFTGDDGKISQWSVILGDNGTGKTSILRSIVSLLPSPQSFLGKRSHLDTEYDLSINNSWRNAWDLKHKDGEKESKISLTILEAEKPFGGNGYEPQMTLSFTTNHKHSSSDNYGQGASKFDTRLFSPVYCFAYGANRKMAEKSLSDENFRNTSETLFKDDALLQNSSEYFLRLDYETAKSRKGSEELKRVKELLLQILPGGVKDIQVVKSGRLQREVQVKTSFGWVKLQELSLGYKTTIAWLIDFATKMIYYNEHSKTPFDEPAILILDEIDLHMHPAWQREIIENLSNIFTKTQFIVTAHSPLIAQAALSSNLVLLKRIGDHIKVENTPDVIRSWRIDQVLTSDLFGLKESRPKEIERKISRRRTLLRKDELTDKQKEELKKLNAEIDAMPIGETKAEMDAMDILKDFAKKLEASKHKNHV
ncbi:MAG: AAA family ATPase [Saprospiraceae bacterium]